MSRRLRLAGAALAAALLAPGCGSSTAPQTSHPNNIAARALPASVQADAGELVAANNRFALDLFRRLPASQANRFCSPYSVSTALAMTSAGAAGTTLAEMQQALRFPFVQDRLHATFAALEGSLDRGVTLSGYELDIANRLWGQQGFTFLPAFLGVMRTSYGAELQPLDFEHAAEASRGTINTWVSGRTNGKIPELLPPGGVNSATRLVLTDAIYFKGTWSTQFDKSQTSDAAFRRGDGTSVSVPTMYRIGQVPTLQVPGARVLDLRYRGEDLSMIVVLPDADDGLPALEASLDADTLAAWVARLNVSEVALYLPRFTFSYECWLNDALTAMGMRTAFAPGAADFSGMDGARDLFVQGAIHKAFVAVDEVGTEAAAATGITVGVTAMPLPLRVDHPFLFAIRDNVTGSLLFLGRVADPSAQ